MKWLSLTCLFAFLMISPAQDLPPVQKEQPYTCEDNEARLDQVTAANLIDGSFIILVARPGRGEFSRALSQKRLHNAREYLLLRSSTLLRSRVIPAIGERHPGLGRIEVYVNGSKFDTLLIGRNRLLCVDCCQNHRLPPFRKSPW
jgi:hypothetical protein